MLMSFRAVNGGKRRRIRKAAGFIFVLLCIGHVPRPGEHATNHRHKELSIVHDYSLPYIPESAHSDQDVETTYYAQPQDHAAPEGNIVEHPSSSHKLTSLQHHYR